MSHHIVPFSVNIKTFSALVILTILTVYTAKYVDLGNFNLVLAMFIASAKALTVFLWFMHLKYDSNQNRAIIASTLGFLALFVGFAAADLFTR